ncbi:hypothetical protein D5S17_09795 [Pseudonocardiaceae bacterium YIM PH 21723]|nr:hypothetical protein D5S17_09795 [Pseudonocardiaceae bacterium YIM PH 21723]
MTSDFDLGDIDLPSNNDSKITFRAPVRGTLTLPDKEDANAPLVIFSHLRASTCGNGAFAYPCPSGVAEVRYDKGMDYLAKALAAKGYAVLVPNLAPLYIGIQQEGPYDQKIGYMVTLDRIRDRLVSAAQGGANDFGATMKGRVDTSKVAIAGQGRSGRMLAPLAIRWKQGPVKPAAILAVAPLYRVARYGEAEGNAPDTSWSTAPPTDIPYFGLVPSADGVIEEADANQYLSHYLSVPRTAPAQVAVTEEPFGHNFFNTALSSIPADDRLGCLGKPCVPTAEAHQALLIKSFGDWLDATMKAGQAPELAFAADAAVPTAISGHNAEFLMATPGPKTVLLNPTGKALKDAAGKEIQGVGDVRMQGCRFYGTNFPDQVDRCEDNSATGSTQALATSYVLALRWTGNGAARISVPPNAAAAERLVMQVMPWWSEPGQTGTQVRVTLTDKAGKTASVQLDGKDPALEPRSGHAPHLLGTIRLPLSRFADVDTKNLASVEIGGSGSAGAIAVRSLELS